MSFVKQQRNEVVQTHTIQYISAALRDVSAVELKNLLTRYSQNTEYYADLQRLCQLVWRIADEAGETEKHASRGSLYVAYTTNRHFYGALNRDVMQTFMAQVGSEDEVLIVGATGKVLWQEAGRPTKRVTFWSFKKDIPNAEEVAKFLQAANAYAHVHVVYPRFVSVYEQQVTMSDITYRPEEGGEAAEPTLSVPEYVLEPDLGRVLAFFQTQVRHLLFERLMLETQLAQVSARLVRMDMADHNAQDMLREAERSLRRAQALFMNTRLLETTSGFIQWKRTNT